jgi:sporulation protein YlmC with PRC-barrel domain
MRLSDLVGSAVVTDGGKRLGRVRDVRLVRDGRTLSGFGPAYRVHELVVGKGSLGARLGLEREHVRGPWILVVLFGRHRPRLVPWSAVISVGEGRVRIRAAADDRPAA